MFRHLQICLVEEGAEVFDGRTGEIVARGRLNDIRDYLDCRENEERNNIYARAKRIKRIAARRKNPAFQPHIVRD